jgi:hypothetical protein
MSPSRYQGGVLRPVYVHGSAVSTTWRDASRSLTDLIFDCVSAALRKADLSAADLSADGGGDTLQYAATVSALRQLGA